MGVIIGAFGLIFGLILILFPKAMSKIFRWGYAQPFEIRRGGDKKIKVGLTPTMEEKFGNKAIMIMRVIGIVVIMFSIFAFLWKGAP